MTAFTRPGIRGTIIAASVLTLGLGLAGCTTTASPSPEGDKGSKPPAEQTVAGCAEASAIDGVVMEKLSGEPTDEALLAVAEAYQAAGDALHDGSKEAHDAAHAASEAITTAVKDGAGPGVLEDPAYTEATATLSKFVFDECGYESIAVTAKDFQFAGLPDELPAGMTVLKLKNEGENPHVIEVSRIPDAATTAKQIADNPEAAMKDGLIEMVAGGAFALPGTEGYLATDLKPGRYIVTCMIPDDKNVAHATHGMYHELTVK